MAITRAPEGLSAAEEMIGLLEVPAVVADAVAAFTQIEVIVAAMAGKPAASGDSCGPNNSSSKRRQVDAAGTAASQTLTS